MPVRLDLPPAWKRVPYSEDVVIIGPNWSDDALRMEIRNLPGDSGAPLISLVRSPSGEGLSTRFDSAYPVPGTDLTGPATVLTIRINETTLEALVPASPTHAPLEVSYDMHVGNGAAKRVVFYGRFIINPGVTL